MAACKFFQQGRCTKGDSCPFKHEQSTLLHVSPSTMLPLPTGAPVPFDSASASIKSSQPCRFFMAGKCYKDTQCTYAHTALPSVPTDGPRTLQLRPSLKLVDEAHDSRSKVPCKYYLRGACHNSERCPYAHTGKDESNNVLQAENQDDNADEDDYSRTFLGATVRFGDGCHVSEIELPSDFSAVQIQGLAIDSSERTILTLLQRMGLSVTPCSVKIVKLVDASLVTAEIKARDYTFAKVFCAKLRAQQPSNEIFCGLEAQQITTSENHGQLKSIKSRRIDCRKVYVSWHKPTRTVWLNFGHSKIAQRVSQKFNDGRYTVCGQKITATLPTSSPHSMVSTVVLQNVPGYASYNDVTTAIYRQDDKPRHIELAKTGIVWGMEESFAVVETLLNSIGPAEFVQSTKAEGKRYKATARFADEADARRAVKVLHDKSQDLLNHCKLTVQLVSCARFKIETRVFDMMAGQILPQIQLWKNQHLQCNEYRNTDPLRRFTVIKIEGVEAKEVADASMVLETLLNGKIVMNGSEPAWSTLLSTNSTMYFELKEVEKRFGVLLARSKVKRTLTFYGAAEKFVDVHAAVIALFKSTAVTAYTIDLEPHKFTWICSGGFKQITKVIDDADVSLDVVSTPKKIVVTSSRADYQAVLNMIQTEGDVTSLTTLCSQDQTCAVCWTDAENPVMTHCKHMYCLDCFENLCMQSKSGEKGLSICCQGEAGTCGRIFPLKELQEHLPSNVFEGALQASCSVYVRQRPQEFRHCPTPDCDQIYRVTESARSLTCTNCLQVVCTTCHEQHGMMACAEFKDLKSGGTEAFEKYKRTHGIKDCPRCSTAMEKTDGCNHMTCTGCGAHICWVCLQTFKQSGPCYDHMRVVHGGIGLDIPPEFV